MSADKQLPTAQELATALQDDGDLMGWTVLQIALGLEAQLDRDGWDQPSRLLVLYRDLADMPNMEIEIKQLGPSPVGEDGHEIAGKLTVLAEHITARKLSTPAALFGFALTYEAWMVADPGDVAPSEHPDRVEIRSVLLVDKAGDAWTVIHPRGSTVRALHDDGSSTVQSGGRLVDALRALMNASLEAAEVG